MADRICFDQGCPGTWLEDLLGSLFFVKIRTTNAIYSNIKDKANNLKFWLQYFIITEFLQNFGFCFTFVLLMASPSSVSLIEKLKSWVYFTKPKLFINENSLLMDGG